MSNNRKVVSSSQYYHISIASLGYFRLRKNFKAQKISFYGGKASQMPSVFSQSFYLIVELPKKEFSLNFLLNNVSHASVLLR